MGKMKFAWTSSKINYMISIIANSTNVLVNVKEEYKEDIKVELQIIEQIDSNKILQCSNLGNKLIYGGERKFRKFIKTFNKEMSHEVAAYSR